MSFDKVTSFVNGWDLSWFENMILPENVLTLTLEYNIIRKQFQTFPRRQIDTASF